jgi:hypothetical protein
MARLDGEKDRRQNPSSRNERRARAVRRQAGRHDMRDEGRQGEGENRRGVRKILKKIY